MHTMRFGLTQTRSTLALLALAAFGLTACPATEEEPEPCEEGFVRDGTNCLPVDGDDGGGGEDTGGGGEDAGGGEDTGGGDEDAGGGDEDAGGDDAGGGDEDAGGGDDAGDEDAGGGDDAGDEDAGGGDETFVVFDDAYAAGVSFAPFGGSINDVTITTDEFRSGTSAIKIVVPTESYTGGALVASAPADVSGYDALSFWVKSSKAATLNGTGLGDDTQAKDYGVEANGIPITGDWQRVIVPIPNPSKLTGVSGLMHFAEGSDEGGYDIFIDDIEYINLEAGYFTETLAVMGGAMPSIGVGGTSGTFGHALVTKIDDDADPNTDPIDRTFSLQPRHYDYTSSDMNIATVDEAGVATGVMAGSATISATLDGDAVTGELMVTVTNAATEPAAGAPTPMTPEADVDEVVYSDAYAALPRTTVDTWRTSWSQCCSALSDEVFGSDNVKRYGDLNFAGVQINDQDKIDLTGSTTMHIDLWTPDIEQLRIKIVSTDGAGGPDEGSYVINDTTTPALGQGQWVSLDIPLTDFSRLGGNPDILRTNIHQFVFEARNKDGNGDYLMVGQYTLFIDNIYFC